MGLYYFDYGHGGRDPGATYKGRKESDDVLKVGMKTAAIMRANGHTVDESRTTDKTLSLGQRTNDANKKNYDALVSFHRNAFNNKARGVETYSYPGSNGSRAIALRMQKELVKIGFIDRGAKTANFHMLRESRSLAVLPELGFIDNPIDNKIFDENIDKIAEAIVRSLVSNIKPSTSKETEQNMYYHRTHNNKHPRVKKLQEDLNLFGYNLTVDTSFGPATEKAIRDYQTKNSLTVNGIADTDTLRHIMYAVRNLDKPKSSNNDSLQKELNKYKDKIKEIERIINK